MRGSLFCGVSAAEFSEKKLVFEKSSKTGDGRVSDGSEIAFSGDSEMIFSASSGFSEIVCCETCCCTDSEGMMFYGGVTICGSDKEGVSKTGCSEMMFSEGISSGMTFSET